MYKKIGMQCIPISKHYIITYLLFTYPVLFLPLTVTETLYHPSRFPVIVTVEFFLIIVQVPADVLALFLTLNAEVVVPLIAPVVVALAADEYEPYTFTPSYTL